MSELYCEEDLASCKGTGFFKNWESSRPNVCFHVLFTEFADVETDFGNCPHLRISEFELGCEWDVT